MGGLHGYRRSGRSDPALGYGRQLQSADLKHPYDEHPWQQWDLLTGKPAGPDCAMKLDGFSASDGRVTLTQDDDYQAVVAIDRTTCKTVWQLPKFTSPEKVGTNLPAR